MQVAVEDTAEGTRVGPRALVSRLNDPGDPQYSICTMVTDWPEYRGMVRSLIARGFDEGSCEFLVLDNSAGNQADAYVGTNEFLQASRAPRIIVCHQDILLLEDGRSRLDECLDELSRLAPDWAIAGNAGMTGEGWPVTCLSDPHARINVLGGGFPARVVSLDENFLVIRREANLALSRDLSGFHHYATDLCVIAAMLGWSAYVIDFFLRHESGGTVDARYHASAERLEAKYAAALRDRWVPTIIGRPVWLSGRAGGRAVAQVRRWLGKLTGGVPRNRRAWSADRVVAQPRHLRALDEHLP